MAYSAQRDFRYAWMGSIADSSLRLPTRQGGLHCSKNATICGAQDAVIVHSICKPSCASTAQGTLTVLLKPGCRPPNGRSLWRAGSHQRLCRSLLQRSSGGPQSDPGGGTGTRPGCGRRRGTRAHPGPWRCPPWSPSPTAAATSAGGAPPPARPAQELGLRGRSAPLQLPRLQDPQHPGLAEHTTSISTTKICNCWQSGSTEPEGL